MDLTWTAHQRLDALRPTIDALDAPLTSSVGWLRHAEGVAAGRGIGASYLTASLRDTIVAVVASYVVERADDVSRSYRWSPRHEARPGDDRPRIHLGAFGGHLCEPATARLLAGRRFEVLGSAAAYLARTRPGVPVGALYVPLEDPAATPVDVVTLRSDALLDVSGFSSLSDYLARLSRKARQNARREMRSALEVGGRAGVLDDAQPDTWARLLAAQAARYGRDPDPQPAEREIESLRQCFGEATLISQIEIVDHRRTHERLRRSITYAYKASPHWTSVLAVLDRIPCTDDLVELAVASTSALLAAGGVTLPALPSSDLRIPGRRADKLIGICRALGASMYLSGSGGAGYVDPDAFSRAGIDLQFQDWRPPAVRPRLDWRDITAIDFLARHGSDSLGTHLQEWRDAPHEP